MCQSSWLPVAVENSPNHPEEASVTRLNPFSFSFLCQNEGIASLTVLSIDTAQVQAVNTTPVTSSLLINMETQLDCGVYVLGFSGECPSLSDISTSSISRNPAMKSFPHPAKKRMNPDRTKKSPRRRRRRGTNRPDPAKQRLPRCRAKNAVPPPGPKSKLLSPGGTRQPLSQATYHRRSRKSQI